MNDNIFCMSNPLSTFVSRGNKLYMHFEPSQGRVNQPLVFETGYFAYKHLYSIQASDDIFINFADIIPAHVSENLYNYTTNFEIRFQVPDSTAFYFMPVLYDCNLRIIGNAGRINVKASSGKHKN